MTRGRGILDVTAEMLLAALREIGVEMPIDAAIVGIRFDPFHGTGTVQVLLDSPDLPSVSEGETPMHLELR